MIQAVLSQDTIIDFTTKLCLGLHLHPPPLNWAYVMVTMQSIAYEYTPDRWRVPTPKKVHYSRVSMKWSVDQIVCLCMCRHNYLYLVYVHIIDHYCTVVTSRSYITVSVVQCNEFLVYRCVQCNDIRLTRCLSSGDHGDQEIGTIHFFAALLANSTVLFAMFLTEA